MEGGEGKLTYIAKYCDLLIYLLPHFGDFVPDPVKLLRFAGRSPVSALFTSSLSLSLKAGAGERCKIALCWYFFT